MSMDIPRKSAVRRRRILRVLYGVIGVAALVAITVALSRLEPAAPTVDKSTPWMDTVKRGQMIRQVRGPGTLVPEEILWLPAVTEGRVERILARPGAEVGAQTVILELTNPQLELDALDAQYQLGAARADYKDLKVRLQSQLLEQQARAATVQAEFHQARLRAEADVQLAQEGLLSDLQQKISTTTADELKTRNEIEKSRLDISSQSSEAQLEAQQARIDQLEASYQLRRRELESLKVRAGTRGVLQVVLVEVGQQVTPGTNLARVAEPGNLKAELRIPETQARDVLIGQRAVVDTRNELIQGTVSRIDPSVREGTVRVDVTMEGPLPKGARPDLSVDGTIEIERLDDVLYVGRPAYGQADSTISLFKLVEGGSAAVRVQVRLGRSSVNTVEIVEGLLQEDTVILSDMSAWDGYDRVRLE